MKKKPLRALHLQLAKAADISEALKPNVLYYTYIDANSGFSHQFR